MSTSYGIDFGTTNSVLATTTGKDVSAITLDEEVPVEWATAGFDKVLPTVVGFKGSEPTFGWKAKSQQTDRLEAIKRLFATEDEVTIGSAHMKVEEVAAMFFRHLQGRAAAAGLAEPLDRAVVTIPANSRGKARFRTKVSAGLAGIEVIALMNEPTAAAMAHARAIGENQRILVFDWGGGTLDVTVLQAVDGTFIEQASKGIQRLGGLDVDQALFDFLKGRMSGVDNWPEADVNRFKLEVELGKVKLSTQTSCQLAYSDGQFVELTRGQLEEVVLPLIERTRDPVDVCLRDSPGRIDHLVMVGGSSKMPIIRRFVADIVGTDPSEGVDPMTAIAEGAAIAAGVLSGTVTDVDFFVGTEHALGTVVNNNNSPPEGEFSVLIRRHTMLPARATDAYTPALDNQEKVNLRVIEGDPDLPITHEDNVILKNWTVDLLEPRPVAEAGFDVTYDYDVDGILHVKVVDQKTSTIMMDDELAFGAAEDRKNLVDMRRRVDAVMAGATSNENAQGDDPVTEGGLSRESMELIAKTKSKVLDFVPDGDRLRLEKRVADLESASVTEEDQCRQALQRELRNHAYLL